MTQADEEILAAVFANWDSAPIGDHLRTAQYGLSVRGSESGRYPILRMNCQVDGKVSFRDLQFVDISDEQFSSFRLNDGDLLFNRTNSIELVGRTSVFRSSREAVFASYLIRLALDQSVWWPEFVNYFMNLPAAQRELKKLASRGVSQANINASKLREFAVPKPPLTEQLKIAAVLGEVQAAVDVEGELIRVIRELKQTALGQFFSRGLRGEPQKETEIGPVPESWEIVALGKHLKAAQYGLSVKGKSSGVCPILRMNCQVDGRVVFRNLQYVDLDERTRSAFRLRSGDLLFNRTNSAELVGRTALFRSNQEAVFASYLIRLALDESIWVPEFVNYFMNMENTQIEIKKLASRGVSQANISASKLKEFPIPRPDPTEQREIVARLEAIDAKLAHHEARQKLLRELFRTLLRDLMTARRRVTDLDLPTTPLP